MNNSHKEIRARAQAQFPAVLLTLLSIIQALALELMWSKIMESSFLFQWSFSSLIAWGMLLTAFLGILQIWVMYATMVMGFIWQPSLRDSILPFIIGIQEFLLISLIGEEFSTWWLYVLASVFISGNWVTHSSLKRARQEPQNAQFFANLQPATLKDFLPAAALIGVFLILGIIMSITGNQSWLPLCAIVIANGALVVQILGVRRLWRSLMGMSA